MKSEQQRIAIAEACGWTNIICTPSWPCCGELMGRKSGQAGNQNHLVPDYLNDLNAMHEAEKILTTAQRMDYADILCDLRDGIFSGVMATAAERAEAFLKTLNLWKP